jgi:5-methylcytosine-specific restriction endonuclease McrA
MQVYKWQISKKIPYKSYLTFHREYLPLYKRADFKCEVCGANNCRLNVHHKDKRIKQPLNNNLENLLLVCSKCHQSFHKGDKNFIKRNERRARRKERIKNFIMELTEQGFSLSEIGKILGFSKQRTYQIKTTS